MADNSGNPLEWLQGIGQMQQKMWEAWSSSVARPTMPGFGGMSAMPGFGGMPWQNPLNMMRDNMEHWWGGMPGMGGSPEQMVLRNMLGMGERFIRSAEEVMRTFQNVDSGMQAGKEWTALLEQSIQRAKEVMGAGGFPNLMMGENPFGAPFAEMWKQMVSGAKPPSVPEFFAPWITSAMQSGSNLMRDGIEKMAGMPGLGISREHQEKLQSGLPLVVEYQEASRVVGEILGKAGEQALDILHKKILEYAASDRQVGSLRELYYVWVESAEQGYAGAVRSQEYAAANARMVNAMVRLRRHMQDLSDEVLEGLNLPSRKELDNAYGQIHSLRVRIRDLEAEVRGLRQIDLTAEVKRLRDDLERIGSGAAPAGMDELRGQVVELRGRVEELRGQPSGQPPELGRVAVAGGGEAEDAARNNRARPPVRKPAVAAKSQGE